MLKYDRRYEDEDSDIEDLQEALLDKQAAYISKSSLGEATEVADMVMYTSDAFWTILRPIMRKRYDMNYLELSKVREAMLNASKRYVSSRVLKVDFKSAFTSAIERCGEFTSADAKVFHSLINRVANKLSVMSEREFKRNSVYDLSRKIEADLDRR